MSIGQLSRTSILQAIRDGHTSRSALATHFEVLLTSKHLSDYLDPLIASGEVVEHDNGLLHVNDLIEQIPHDPKEIR